MFEKGFFEKNYLYIKVEDYYFLKLSKKLHLKKEF